MVNPRTIAAGIPVLQGGEDVNAGRKVVSKPGAAIKVTQLKLTPRGNEMLRVKQDVHIPGPKRKKTTA